MGSKRGLWIAVVLAGAFSVLLLTSVLTTSLPTGVQKWEYLVVSFGTVRDWCGIGAGRDNCVDSQEPKAYCHYYLGEECIEAPDTEALLDFQGRNGWELVAVVGQIDGDQEFVFKRPLP